MSPISPCSVLLGRSLRCTNPSSFLTASSTTPSDRSQTALAREAEAITASQAAAVFSGGIIRS
jgi:hypothetical protein